MAMDMICVEGYKAFRGSMLISPKAPGIEPFTLTGDWLYKPDTGCWYCQGRSFMDAICTPVATTAATA